MTLNEARDKIVAADPDNRTVFVTAECAFFNHYPPRSPEARQAYFTVTVHNDGLAPIQSFGGTSLGPLVQRAIEYVTDRASDESATATEEPEGQ